MNRRQLYRGRQKGRFMSLVSKSGSLRIACVAMMAFAVCMFAAPADAHMRDRSAYVVGTHFPYVSGYRYHPSGFWYSANLSGCRYPARPATERDIDRIQAERARAAQAEKAKKK